MKDSTLGKIIDSTAQRDAIHIAIAPVTASARLAPGTHVGFLGDSETVGVCEAPIGIVDPFLEGAVFKGERFFLCLYPRSITSLRHEWTHPAFEKQKPEPDNSKAESEKWLRAFCDEHDYINYENMLSELVRDGGYVVQQGGESAQNVGLTEEFKRHFLNVTGREAKGFFSCSC